MRAKFVHHFLSSMLWASWIAAAGCGGAEPTSTGPQVAPSAPREEPDLVAVEGITGSLTQRDVNEAMERRQHALSRCFARDWGVEELYGVIRFHFRIAPDGTVAEVYPTGSTLGSSGVERCLVEVVQKTTFPKPRGNAEAEFDWHMFMDPPGHGAGFEEWDESHLDELLSEHGKEALGTCQAQQPGVRYQVTAYIDGSGRVLSLSAIPSDPTAVGKTECLIDAVRAWEMPRPERGAKVTFVLR